MANPTRGGTGPAPPGRLARPCCGRRAWLRLLAGSAAAAAGAAGLGACGSAAPTHGARTVTLVLATYDWGGTGQELLAEGAARFEDAVRGVRVRATAAQTNPGALISAIASDTGPDVLWAQDYGAMVGQAALLPLDAYIARDRIDPAIWPAGKMAMLRTAQGTFGLPAYTGGLCYALRLADWDGLRLERPAPAWTQDDFVQAARGLTADAGGRHRYGASLQWYSTWLGDNAWAFVGFGGAQMHPDGASSTLSTPGSVAAGKWLYSLLWPGLACTRDQLWNGVGLPDDSAAMAIAAPWSVAADAVNYGSRFAWDYHPFPVFAQGRATYANSDFFAISARTRAPEEAWALLQWVTAGTEWQRWVMRTGLLPPATNALWDEWMARVRAVAPPLQDKSLEWFADAARGGYAHPRMYYRYADQQAAAIAGAFVGQLWNRLITDVGAAFSAADSAINALLNRAAAGDSAAAAALGAVERALAARPAELPAPPDASTAPGGSAALGGAIPSGYRLVGNGAGLGGDADAGVFAGGITRAESKQFTCRLTSLRNVSGPYLAGGGQAGLMARQDLSADAPFVAVAATGGGGIQVSVRPLAGLPARVWSGAAEPDAGLLPPAEVTRDNRSGLPEYLLRPLWLRLRRDGGVWTCLTSADGRAWHQAGPSVRAAMAGCWVGLFATADNGSAGFAPGQTIAAEFADLTLAPGAPVQIGLP